MSVSCDGDGSDDMDAEATSDFIDYAHVVSSAAGSSDVNDDKHAVDDSADRPARCNIDVTSDGRPARCNIDVTSDGRPARCNIDVIKDGRPARCNIDVISADRAARCNNDVIIDDRPARGAPAPEGDPPVTEMCERGPIALLIDESVDERERLVYADMKRGDERGKGAASVAGREDAQRHVSERARGPADARNAAGDQIEYQRPTPRYHLMVALETLRRHVSAAHSRESLCMLSGDIIEDSATRWCRLASAVSGASDVRRGFPGGEFV
ncbi:hypothetical protein EYF80_009848 [Liparis tanakae]|uniref:Uncharacterized protein n=1 Tax=Liparis tanakae TaxID=230148 RepID=A0A4Z2IPR3_9TELE|nr:hypothetical protein EYF80_009848 [Liparis tanakae]